MNQKNFKILTVLFALVLILSSVLAACGGEPTQPAVATDAPAAQATEAPAVEQPAATEAPAQTEAPAATQAPASEQPAASEFKPVWYAPAPHPYFETVKEGVEAFAKDMGITVEEQIGPDWEQGSQNERMEALAAKGFNAFTVYPADASGANGLYEELTAKGIKIVNFGTTTAQPTTASFAVATDVKAAAKEAAEQLIKAMGGKGNIINVLEVLEDPNTVLRKQGIEEVVAKYPDIKIIQEVSGMKSVEEAVQKVGDAVAANADKVDGIIATGYTPSVAIAQVLTEYKDQGGTRTIHAVGIDTDEVVMQAIKDGVMDGTIVQNPYGHGYLSLLLLAYMAQGYTPKPDVYFVDAGFVFATKDNLDTYNEDILKVTEQIKNELLDKYLQK